MSSRAIIPTLILTVFILASWIGADQALANGAARGITIINSFPYPAGWDNTADATWDGQSLWVSNVADTRIYQIDPSSGSVLSYVDAPANNPYGLACDGIDLYSADYAHTSSYPDFLYTLTTSGGILNSWEVPDSPNAKPKGAAYDLTTGHLWLADSNYDMIYELDPGDGSVISSFAAPGPAVRGLTWYNGYVFALDDAQDLLYKLDTAGNIVGSASVAALGGDPEGLAFDGQYFWITDETALMIYQVDVDFMVLPIPDVKVNGDDGPLYLTPSDDITVTIALDPGDLDGQPADWWVLGGKLTSDPWWAKFRQGQKPKWTKSTTPIRFAGATLRTVNGYTVLGPRTLPGGDWVFVFAVDDNKDGVLDSTFQDIVEVNIN